MSRLGLAGARRGKRVRTTTPDTSAPCPLDRVNRQFKASRPNELWVSDFTNFMLVRLAEVGIEPIGYIPPAEAEANYWQQLAQKQETASST
jgi:transposase InsO family protein